MSRNEVPSDLQHQDHIIARNHTQETHACACMHSCEGYLVNCIVEDGNKHIKQEEEANKCPRYVQKRPQETIDLCVWVCVCKCRIEHNADGPNLYHTTKPSHERTHENEHMDVCTHERMHAHAHPHAHIDTGAHT
jgi:hypothetical protein